MFQKAFSVFKRVKNQRNFERYDFGKATIETDLQFGSDYTNSLKISMNDDDLEQGRLTVVAPGNGEFLQLKNDERRRESLLNEVPVVNDPPRRQSIGYFKSVKSNWTKAIKKAAVSSSFISGSSAIPRPDLEIDWILPSINQRIQTFIEDENRVVLLQASGSYLRKQQHFRMRSQPSIIQLIRSSDWSLFQNEPAERIGLFTKDYVSEMMNQRSHFHPNRGTMSMVPDYVFCRNHTIPKNSCHNPGIDVESILQSILCDKGFKNSVLFPNQTQYPDLFGSITEDVEVYYEKKDDDTYSEISIELSIQGALSFLTHFASKNVNLEHPLERDNSERCDIVEMTQLLDEQKKINRFRRKMEHDASLNSEIGPEQLKRLNTVLAKTSMREPSLGERQLLNLNRIIEQELMDQRITRRNSVLKSTPIITAYRVPIGDVDNIDYVRELVKYIFFKEDTAISEIIGQELKLL
jgi:hypothetical protein